MGGEGTRDAGDQGRGSRSVDGCGSYLIYTVERHGRASHMQTGILRSCLPLVAEPFVLPNAEHRSTRPPRVMPRVVFRFPLLPWATNASHSRCCPRPASDFDFILALSASGLFHLGKWLVRGSRTLAQKQKPLVRITSGLASWLASATPAITARHRPASSSWMRRKCGWVQDAADVGPSYDPGRSAFWTQPRQLRSVIRLALTTTDP